MNETYRTFHEPPAATPRERRRNAATWVGAVVLAGALAMPGWVPIVTGWLTGS